MSKNKEKVVVENSSEECIERDHGLTPEYREGYRKGMKQASKWRSSKTLPQEDGTKPFSGRTDDRRSGDTGPSCDSTVRGDPEHAEGSNHDRTTDLLRQTFCEREDKERLPDHASLDLMKALFLQRHWVG